MKVKDKVVIVTGASSGIGEATARLLAKKGAKVALAGRTTDKLQQLSKELKDSLVVKTDMTRGDEVRRMVKQTLDHYGKIDVLVNNAGRGMYMPVAEMEIKDFIYLFELNVVGPLIAMQMVIPVMKEQGRGVIVNISSGTALSYFPGSGGYSATKRALGGLSLTARNEQEKDGIKVSLVFPYITKTRFGEKAIKPVDFVYQPRRGQEDEIPEADAPEVVAEKILEAIRTEEAVVFVHDWMGKIGDRK